MNLRLVTYNVDMRRLQRRRRMEAIADTLATLEPDVVGLQEVTREGLQEMASNTWFRGMHLFPDPVSAWSREAYRTFILTREPLMEPRCRPFSISRMGRDLVYARVASDPELTVGTAHLESLPRWTTVRQTQLGEALGELDGTKSAILLGDLNVMTGWDPEPSLPPGWADAWFSLDRPHSQGLTYDAQVNPLARNHRQRLDRVLFRGGGRLEVRSMDLIGRMEIEPGLYPSDHFGLVCDLASAR